MTRLTNSVELGARVFIGIPFLLSGLGKLAAYGATAGYMASQGVPGFLLPLVIATEVGGALAIMLGWHTRIAAFLLGGFTMLTAFVFHTHFADQTQMIMFMKNVAIAGAYMLLVIQGAGAYSLDQRFGRATRAATA